MRDEAVEIYSGAVLICKLLHRNVEVSCDLIYCNGSPSSDAFEGDETLFPRENNNYHYYHNSGGLSEKIERQYVIQRDADCQLKYLADLDVDSVFVLRCSNAGGSKGCRTTEY